MNEEIRNRALRLLEKRDMSRKMLVDKLLEKGASPEDAAEVADRLCELRVVDDSRYAALVVRHYAGRGYGERRIREELYRRGIDRALWPDALEEMPETDDAALRFLRSRLRGDADPAALKRAADALVRRGYGWDDVRAAAERYKQETEEQI